MAVAMAMDQTDDDYWNTSETKAKAFNFDDDVLSPREILAIGVTKTYVKPPGSSEEFIFSSTSISNVKPPLLSLDSLVSPKILDLILLAHSGELPKEPRPEPEQTVAVTIKRLILGRSCSLHTYRSLKSKAELLDAAVAVGDGNAIITVLGFLMQTLNQEQLVELLRPRPVAVSHYASYLDYMDRLIELADVFTKLGRPVEAAICAFKDYHKKEHSLFDTRKHMIELRSSHFMGIEDNLYSNLMCDYLEMLEWQHEVDKPELYNVPALQNLAYCVEKHGYEPAGHDMSPVTFCKRHQIPPIQSDWVFVNIYIKMREWERFNNFVLKKGWLGRVTFDCHVPAEALALRLGPSITNAGEKELTMRLINSVKNPTARMRIAKSFKLHAYVIRCLAEHGDRQSLTHYLLTLSPQADAEDYILAVKTLKDKSVKWKN